MSMSSYYLRESWRSFRHHGGLATTAVLSLTAALLLCAGFLLLTWNAEAALKALGDRREMVVYLNDGVSDARRQAVMDKLHELYGSVTYVSKDEAWKEFSRQVGDPALLEAVDENPLPASLRVHLRPQLQNYPAMQEAANQVSQFPEVEDVRFGAEWVQRLDTLGSRLTRGTYAVGLVVALAILFVVYNTIRLTVLARRPQVEIMSRLGATDRFIAVPFVIEAVFEGVLAGAIALGILFGAQQLAARQVVDIAFLPWRWIGAFLAGVALLAWVAATFALSRVLRAVGP